jgi:hypothetical protein
MKKILETTLAAAILFSGGALAAFYSGNDILEECEKIDSSSTNLDYLSEGSCYGYIVGIADAARTLESWENTENKFCLPDDVSGREVANAVIKELEKSPDQLHLSAGSLTLNALYDAFPCEREQ